MSATPQDFPHHDPRHRCGRGCPVLENAYINASCLTSPSGHHVGTGKRQRLGKSQCDYCDYVFEAFGAGDPVYHRATEWLASKHKLTFQMGVAPSFYGALGECHVILEDGDRAVYETLLGWLRANAAEPAGEHPLVKQINAFDALLAVAQAADRERTHLSYLSAAVDSLTDAHPGWREWGIG